MRLKATDIARTASASEIIYGALRTAIIEGEIPIGTALRQDEIAKMFNTSRIPVREAISRLEEQGLIKSQRYKGAVVAGLSADEVAEIFDLRALVEPEILRDSVPKMSTKMKELARQHCDAFAESSQPLNWGELNRIFHSTLYADSSQKYFISVAENAMDRVDRYIRAQLVMSDGMERAKQEHLAILIACEQGDADHASSLLRDHILGARDSLLDVFDKCASV